MVRIQVGDRITIRYSKKLKQGGNVALVNKEGVVNRLVFQGNKLVGANIEVKTMKKQKCYFIPLSSIEGWEKINRIRALSILKSTVL